MRLNAEDLTKVATQLDDAVLSRFLLYLEPKKIGSLLTSVKKYSPQVFGRLVGNLSAMSAAESRKDLDMQLLESIETLSAETAGDAIRNYLPYYHRIIDTLDEDLEDEEPDFTATGTALFLTVGRTESGTSFVGEVKMLSD